MNTATRRDRFLNLLHRGATTVPVVAQTLGVSERTAYRDIAWLREMGHDVQATPGPGGGVRVACGGRPRSVHFEVGEFIGLALSTAVLRGTAPSPFVRNAEAALDRAHRALSADRQRRVHRLLQRVLVGAPASERTQQTVGVVDEAMLSVVEGCLAQSRAMVFDYVDRQGSASSRNVECVALVLHGPLWYVLAWDLQKDDSRLFRTDRIADPACGEALTRPHLLSDVRTPDLVQGELEGGFVRTPLA